MTSALDRRPRPGREQGDGLTDVTVGVDIGTTSVKALAVDGEGVVLRRARVPHGVRVPAATRLEHDADRAWRSGVTEAYRTASSGLDVAGVQVAAMVPSMCAVDASGAALTPGLLYGDERGGHPVGGDPGTSGELLAFAAWCARAAPEATGLWPAQAMANHALAGVAALDTVVAMMAGDLFDGRTWDEGVATAHGIRVEQLPAVVPTGRAVADVGGAALGSGTIDAYTEQLCAGATEDGDVLVIGGTTLITWLVTAEGSPPAGHGVWTIPALTPGRSMVGGPSNAGGLFLEWAERLVGVTEDDAPLEPGRVPVWLPYVRGERTPLHDPDRRSSVHDLDLTHGPAQLRRAAYEAAGFVVRHHLELAGAPARRIVATRGALHDSAWLQALAHPTGLTVHTVAVPQGGAYGAAYLARTVAGLGDTLADAHRWARIATTVEPDPAWVDPTGERYERFRELTDAG